MMKEFFCDWKRGAGCVALALACLFLAVWLGGEAAAYDFCFHDGISSYYRTTALNNGIRVTRFHWITSSDSGGGFTIKETTFLIPHRYIVWSITLVASYLIFCKTK